MGGTGAEAAGARLEGDVLTVERMLEYPIFTEKMQGRLKKNVGGVVRREFQPGEVVCREGEQGSTAFYILEGEVEVSILTPVASMTGTAKRSGFLGRAQRFFAKLGKRGPQEDEEPAFRSIPIDASVDLDLQKPVATLGEGELFGEMTCRSFYPRSATVRAKTRVVALEMLRSIFDILMVGPLKQQLDRSYRERSLDTHLRRHPLFSGLSDDFLDHLRERVELVPYNPGDVVCKQGDEGDRLYLIRIGFVKVSQESPGGEVVLNYLHRGSFFGETALLAGGKRTATCTALDFVELVEIKKEDFDLMLREFPEIRTGMEEVAREYAEMNARRMQQLSTQRMDEFLRQGLIEAQSLLLIDLERCTRCDECTRACAASHEGITRLFRDGLRYDRYLVTTSCRSCIDPVCMIGCPVGSIRRNKNLEILIEDWCIGCGICARNCPYGNIIMHDIRELGMAPDEAGGKEKAITCDLCHELGTPSCVYACPHEATKRVNPREYFLEGSG